MKKYAWLSAGGSLALGGLAFLYVHGQSPMAKGHAAALRILQEAKEVDILLDKNLLRSRGFLLLTYDSIVAEEDDVERVCQKFSHAESGFSSAHDPELEKAIEGYCEAEADKNHSIEMFKSRNAIFRNSIYYLHSLASQADEEKHGHAGLVRATMLYALLSSEEARAQLETALERSRGGTADVVASHARKILQLKPEIDDLTQKILNSGVGARLEEVRRLYLEDYNQAEALAGMYRRGLMVICVFFLVGILYAVLRAWRAAQALAAMNTTLEQKVAERTRELEESQETILQQQQALVASAKLSALGEMAAGIAHEINNPVAIIKSAAGQIAELAAEEPCETALVAERATLIEKTADRIARIVQGLRVFCGTRKDEESGLYPAERLVEETASLCRERFASHGIQLLVDPMSPDLGFHGNDVQTSQVLLNLLNNAHDAILPLPERWVKVSATRVDGWLEIRVTDSGGGIPAEVAEKLFQPFFTTKEVGKGTGLGLSISLGIMRKQGGDLFLDAHQPHTCFVMRMPYAAPAATNSLAG